jgi:hypothetical protein
LGPVWFAAVGAWSVNWLGRRWRSRRGADVVARGSECALAFVAIGFVLLMVSMIVERPAVGYPVRSVVSIEVAKLVSVSGGPYVVLLDQCLHVHSELRPCAYLVLSLSIALSEEAVRAVS